MAKRVVLLIGILCLVVLHTGFSQTNRNGPPAFDNFQVIGVALTANHASVTRRCNGTFADLGRVEASKEYTEMIQRLTDWGTQHPR